MILDASVLVKLVITEPGSERARDIVRRALSEGEAMACPDIALAEALNALWKQHALLGRLFTFDEKLEKAARSLGIRVLPP